MEFSDDFGVGNSAVRMLYSLFVGKLAGAVLTAIALIILARLMDPAGYGIYTIAVGFSTLLSVIAPFGINIYITKYLAEATQKKNSAEIARIVTDAYFVIIIVALIFTIMGVLISNYAAQNIFAASNVPAGDLVIAAITVFFATIYLVSYSALVGLGRGKDASVVTVLTALILLIGSVGLVLLGYGVYGAMVGLLISDIVGFVISTYMVYADLIRRYAFRLPNINFGHITSILKFSLPLATNNLLSASGINYFSVLLLGALTSAVVLGNYGVAFKGFSLMVIFYSTMTTVLLPAITKALAKTNDKKKAEEIYNKTMLYSMLISLPVIIFIGVFASQIISVLISSSYSSAPLYMSLIAGGVIVDFIGLYTMSFFTAGGEVYKVLKYSIASTSVEIISLVLLVPAFGAIGVIIAVFYLGNIVDDVLYWMGMKKVFGIKPDFWLFVKIMLSGFLLLVMFEAINIAMIYESVTYINFAIDIILSVLVLFVIYPAALVALKLVDRYIIEDMKKSTRKVPFVEPISNWVLNYMIRLEKLIWG